LSDLPRAPYFVSEGPVFDLVFVLGVLR
jgi:hypothetical protein